MEKDQFIHVVNHFSGSSVQEAQEVLSLKESFPYSQLLHALSARVTKDHGFSNHAGELQLAAVYAADRAALKEIMLEEFDPEEQPVAEVAEINAPQAAVATIDDNDNVAEELLHDLERLNALKVNFEKMFSDGFVADVPTAAAEATPAEPPAIETQTEPTPIKSGLSKKERIVALAKALENKSAEKPAEAEPPKTRKKRKAQEGEELIAEIVNSKSQIEPENEKQKEQIDLIDQFIKTQPSILSAKDKLNNSPEGDLSSPHADFGDNIISETLVEILLKQGKKDRAIEVLKKLIWKFPQKKAYFAAQIEDLKK
ncbi:hypothetical protein [Pseudochryseolinea flava]|uniref:Tetratricopeptide repeat protein n=1 Tax=Pseudochryseolinea flava TaxID=2059302 RepID=A0A364Y3E5_9BACT|nr:hypothetical protein [Pseudochryseolinea flava]RAW01249.1 hypothetical protein DQQ10_10075 [Pseudochryseolinea flava]